MKLNDYGYYVICSNDDSITWRLASKFTEEVWDQIISNPPHNIFVYKHHIPIFCMKFNHPKGMYTLGFGNTLYTDIFFNEHPFIDRAAYVLPKEWEWNQF